MPEVLVKWYDKQLMRDLKPMIERMEKAAARRIAAAAKRRCPVWDGEGRKISPGDDTWKARKPGSLRKSIRVEKSKYKDGGYIVLAGNYDVFYASFVELGTKSWWARGRTLKRGKTGRVRGRDYARHPLPEDPFLRGPLERESKLFWKRLNQMFSDGVSGVAGVLR